MRVDHFASFENIVPRFQTPSILPLPPSSPQAGPLIPLNKHFRQPVLNSIIKVFIIVKGWKLN